MSDKPNPYVDDEVVYTVSLEGLHKPITGRFFTSALEGPFWTLEVDTPAGWVAVNPRHIVSVRPATESEFRRYFSDESRFAYEGAAVRGLLAAKNEKGGGS